MIRVDTSNANRHDAFVLLQRGVFVERPDASTVMEFICTLLNTKPESAKREVGTIIMDNAVVDDPESARIQNATSLVLSGAMPGLVGAMLRSNSPYKTMRATITSTGSEGTAEPLLKIKLLNTVLRDHMNDVLNHGFWIQNEQE